MYNFTVGGVQFLPTALFNQLRRGCSTSNGQGVQPGRYIQQDITRISKRASRTIRRKHSKSSTIASASTWASLKLPYSNMPSNSEFKLS